MLRKKLFQVHIEATICLLSNHINFEFTTKRSNLLAHTYVGTSSRLEIQIQTTTNDKTTVSTKRNHKNVFNLNSMYFYGNPE